MRRALFVLAFSLFASLSWSQLASSGVGSDLLSLPLFDDSETYTLSGATLNEWLRASKAQQTELLLLKDFYVKVEPALNVASQAVSASATSFDAYRKSINAELWTLRAALVVGGVIVVWRTLK